ncbi:MULTISPECIES: class I adenylate-forming enzyme family protein [unclassified Cupriavidus]|uniref:class I adenylate-forming enzyme family protein n=1 Tax=unclassified Cupriavidus TaxID=2640874 RepID=UPI001CECB4C4|nr:MULTISPECIES: AMP-binding protein [unclassified Cupriavidus]
MTKEDAQPSRAFNRIHEVVRPWVKAQPDAPALQDSKLKLTYTELSQAIDSVAERLQDLGVRPGDRVLLVAENCVSLATLVLACSACDAWAVVVNPRLSAREIDNFLEHSDARRAIYVANVSRDALDHGNRARANLEAFPYLGDVLVGPLNAAAAPEPVSRDPAQQVAAMIYTSGTSGSPKGVMLTHANFLYMASLAATLRRLGPQDIVYGILPMAHVVGLSSQLLGAVSCGCTLLLEERFSPEVLHTAICAKGVTVFLGVPAMFARLLEWCAKTRASVAGHRLRIIGASGSPLMPELKHAVESAFGMPLQNGYGLTELSPTVAQTSLDAPRTDCAAGMPIPGLEVRIVDNLGNDVERCSTGELWVRGPNLMKGYYKAPEQTRIAVNAEGWFNTGDLARQDADGALFIVGRTKELIIRSGFNVYPVEVEQVLNSHPGIVQSAVVGRQVEGNEEVVAFIELASDAPVTRDALLNFLRERLSPYKLPAEVRVMHPLPAAPTGKLLKGEIKKLAAVAADARQVILS